MGKIDLIFKKRFGGSVNIRGISYQIRYSVLRALELMEDKISSITLEGIEDVDLKGFSIDSNTFIQVKTSSKEWKWSQLKNPIKNFIEVYKIKPNAGYVLILNSPFKGDVGKLSKYKELVSSDKKYIQEKFVELCKELNISRDMLIEFLDKLSIMQVDERKLELELRKKFTENLNMQTNASNVFLSLMVSRFLDWAIERKVITKLDIVSFISDVNEKLSIEQKFQAVGNGLINKINWDTNNLVNDFYEGKNAKPSHISANADFRRVRWLEILNKAVMKNKLCIIKASSGQGKSTLLFRYANDYWLKESIYQINVLNNLEHIELLLEYLRYRSSFGLPLLVLIDNVNFKVQYWADLIEACAGFNINFLLTIRKEDWFRYGRENLHYEVIEPYLDLNEAKEIFKLLKNQNKIDPTIKSPEIAFEDIGNEKLLMEYVYLITHGEMLYDRLTDQIAQIDRNSEDPVKIDILRKGALANIYNTPLDMHAMIANMQFTSDPQKVFESLEGEYLRIEDGLIYEMHWIRTAHLYKILFKNYIEPFKLALDIIDFIPSEHLKVFISGLLSDSNTDKEFFIQSLIGKVGSLNSKTIISIIEGIYIAGEVHFFILNRSRFDEANDLLGYNGPFFLTSEHAPIAKSNFLKDLIKIAGEDKGINFIKLKNISDKILHSERGKEFCIAFLDKIISNIDFEKFQNDPINTARLLDWINYCEINFALENKFIGIIYTRLKTFQTLPIDELIIVIQVLFNLKKDLYWDWYNSNSEIILKYLKFLSNSIYLDINDEKLSFMFIPIVTKDDKVHEETIKRVELFQKTLPFINEVSSEGVYFFPDKMKPSIDESIKKISKKTILPILELQKNIVLLEIIKENYYSDSYYNYQNFLYNLRKDTLSFFKELNTIIYKMVKGVNFYSRNSFEKGELLGRIINSATKFPNLPQQTNALIKKQIDKVVSDWALNIKFFTIQFSNFINEQNERDLNVALLNLKSATENIQKFDLLLDKLYEISAKYFTLDSLETSELQTYNSLYDIIEFKYKNKPQEKVTNPLRYMRDMRNNEMNNNIEIIKERFIDEPHKYIFSNVIAQKESLTFYSIMFEIKSLGTIFEDLLNIFEKLFPIRKVVHFYCLIPVKNKKRIFDGYYLISSTTIEKVENLKDMPWEALAPINDDMDRIQGLPDFEIEISANDKFTGLLSLIKLNLECVLKFQSIIISYLDPYDEYDKKLIEKYNKDIYEMSNEIIGGLKELYNIEQNKSISEVIANMECITEDNIIDVHFSEYYNIISSIV